MTELSHFIEWLIFNLVICLPDVTALSLRSVYLLKNVMGKSEQDDTICGRCQVEVFWLVTS
jgi:hypothetical protein